MNTDNANCISVGSARRHSRTSKVIDVSAESALSIIGVVPPQKDTALSQRAAQWLRALAVHAFMNPDADRIVARGGGKMKGVVGYNATAARRAWNAMQNLFAEVFGTGAR
jgi:dienelactone hydrolase